jgi:hypothetical protein
MQGDESKVSRDSKITPEPKIITRNGIKVVLMAVGFLMLLFPPWTNTFSRPGAAVSKSPAGYSLIFSPPEPKQEAPIFGVELDLKRLLLQMLLLAGAFGVLAYTDKKRSS